jgi:hypothetical protein
MGNANILILVPTEDELVNESEERIAEFGVHIVRHERRSASSPHERSDMRGGK